MSDTCTETHLRLCGSACYMVALCARVSPAADKCQRLFRSCVAHRAAARASHVDAASLLAGGRLHT